MDQLPDLKKSYPRSQSESTNEFASNQLLRPKSCQPGRKQLPAIPDSDSVKRVLTPRPMDRLSSNPNGDLGYGPFFLEYSLMAEYQMLKKQKLPGIYVIPSAISPLRWNGVLFVRQGLYEGGVFRFSLDIPTNFPDGECPTITFSPSVYHPVIDPVTGVLDVKRAFHKWKRNYHHLWQVLMYARRVFMKVDTEGALNAEAAVLYEQDNELFQTKVLQSIEKARELLYSDPDAEDDHAIRFSKWDKTVHEEAKNKMLERGVPESGGHDMNHGIQSLGLSWMKPGSSEIFSKINLDTA